MLSLKLGFYGHNPMVKEKKKKKRSVGLAFI